MNESPTISDYQYNLPEEKIAKHPLANRDGSKLLVWKKGTIRHSQFKDIVADLPTQSLMVFNDTRVLPARLEFYKETGAKIEIFLLEPVSPFTEMARAMEAKTETSWKCLIGNKKRWKTDKPLNRRIVIGNEEFTLTISYDSEEDNIIRFNWNKDIPFAQLVSAAGETPIPPYLKRKSEKDDQIRYQTIYSKNNGAVAAPTAGLHFTDQVLSQLSDKGIEKAFLTLHVSAGTFKPVEAQDYRQHDMHSEQISVDIGTISKLASFKGPILSVGTTSMRTLESLYWYGIKIMEDPNASLHIEKLYPYSIDPGQLPDAKKVFKAIFRHMEGQDLDTLIGTTEIFIFPGYEFKVCKGLITNFHMPGSTLLLLVAAFTGGQWKNIYNEALSQEYRFLSYGDSTLLLP